MNNKLKLTIVSQEEKLLDQEVEAVTLPTSTGFITLLKDHQPLISKLVMGEMTYQVDGKKAGFFLTQGFVNKQLNNQVLVVVDAAFSDRELNNQKIQVAIAKAKEAFKVTKDRRELLMIETSLKQLFWELQVARKAKKSN